jgi:hypothetical protein
MFSAAWYTKRFEIIKSSWKEWSLHMMAGTSMGIGASLTPGGNDTQLLLALPPARIVAVLGELTGIWFGQIVKAKVFKKA